MHPEESPTDSDPARIGASDGQRFVVDRRARPTPMLSRYWLRGRRRGGRRDGETADIYVDRYSRAEWLSILGMLTLTVIDWAWTWAHLRRGVGEANPIMAWAYESGGIAAFTALKLGITGLCVFFLLLHARFRRTRSLLPIVLGIYLILMLVHAATELAVRT